MARSIRSDVDNLLRLINTFNLLPEGLYARQAAEVRQLESSTAVRRSPATLTVPALPSASAFECFGTRSIIWLWIQIKLIWFQQPVFRSQDPSIDFTFPWNHLYSSAQACFRLFRFCWHLLYVGILSCVLS